jgi:hypothetical protein
VRPGSSPRFCSIVEAQPCACAEVNQGPSAIFEAFLSEPAKYPVEHVLRLRQCMARFMDACGEGLLKNDSLIRALLLLAPKRVC